MPNTNDDKASPREDVILYSHPSSFHGQKVLLTLLEKNIKFESKVINLFGGENRAPSFLKLNPKGQVPVLQHGDVVVTESTAIVDYLDDKFRDGDCPVLLPLDGSESYTKMIRYLQLLESINVRLLTFGTCVFPELTSGAAFSLEFRKGRQETVKKENESSEKTEILSADRRTVAEARKSIFKRCVDKNQVEEEISLVEEKLQQIEKDLSARQEEESNWWLCGEHYTKGDVYLAVTFMRFVMLGISYRLVDDEAKRPCLKALFEKLKQRPAIKLIMKETKVT